MGSVHALYIDPTSPEGIEGIREYLVSVFGSVAKIVIHHVEPRKWGVTDVVDCKVEVFGVSQISLRVLYRIVRASPLKLAVWFDDAKNHGCEIMIHEVVAPIVDPPTYKAPYPLSHWRM